MVNSQHTVLKGIIRLKLNDFNSYLSKSIQVYVARVRFVQGVITKILCNGFTCAACLSLALEHARLKSVCDNSLRPRDSLLTLTY